MGLETKPVVNFGPACPRNATIPELISRLKSEFRESEFDKVQQVLLGREESLKTALRERSTEVENLRKECDLKEEKYSEAVLLKLVIEDELSKCKRECNEIQEKVTRLNEDQRVLGDRVKRAEESKQKLSDDFTKAEIERKDTIIELRKKISQLNSEKASAEAEVEAWKKKFGDLEARVSMLEEDTTRLLNVDPVVKVKVEDDLGLMQPNLNAMMGEKENRSNGNSINEVRVNSGNTNMMPQTKGNGKLMDIIEVNDSDDEVPIASMAKRKRASSCYAGGSENDDDNATSIGKCKTNKISDLIHESKDSSLNHFLAGPDSSCADALEATPQRSHNPVFIRRCEETAVARHNFIISSSSSDSDCSSNSEDDSDSYMDYLVATFRDNNAWRFEADMLQAFMKDPVLCMNAVCALYRQQSSMDKSVEVSVVSKDRGFTQFDALRGTALAEFLIDGDPQKRLRKSPSELLEHDPKAVDECRTLATGHSKQLFKIFRKKEDPFFP